MFAKDRFGIDLEKDTVSCPAGHTAPIRRGKDRAGTAHFGDACTGCPLREQCTKAAAERSVSVGPHEQQLADARVRQRNPDWVADYRATDPKWNARSGILCAAITADATPASAAPPKSAPTSLCWRPPSTSNAWRHLPCSAHPPGAGQQLADQPAGR